MAINPALLVSAAMLQDYFVDKDTGLPLAGGIITLYQDSSRTTLKNWYEQESTGTGYTYIPLPNPMTLSAVGTMQDDSGQDIIPFYYPYSEVDNTTPQKYYITVDSALGERQFVRENFPYSASSTPSGTTISTLDQILVNNVFWRNNGTVTPANPGSPTMNQTGVLAPGANNGYSYPDIIYLRSVTGATDVISFNRFAVGTFLNPNNQDDVTPEFYLNWTTTGAGTGENFKVVQIPVDLHLLNLQGVSATFTIYAQLGSPAPANLSIYLYQFNGSAATSPMPMQQGVTVPLTVDWTQYSFQVNFPPPAGVTLPSTTGDDAFYIQIGIPLNTTCNINIAKPCLYIGDVVPTNSFVTYDKVDSVISLPRTGDVRTSLNAFAPWGWVLCNDGVIGPAGGTGVTAARNNTDTWPLYSLLWGIIVANSLPNAIYTSTGSSSTYGATALIDWGLGKQLALSKQLGAALASAGLSSLSGGATTWTVGQAGGHEKYTMASTDLVQHTHDDPSAIPFAIATGGGAYTGGSGFGGTSTVTGGVTGYTAQTAISLVQATTFYNVFYKL